MTRAYGNLRSTQPTVPVAVIVGCLTCMALLAFPALVQARSSRNPVAGAYIDSGGALHLVDRSGHDTKPDKQKDQVSFSSPQIADDRQTVGWLAEFPNCCTSYPIPLTLVIYRDGKIIQQLKPGMMIVGWRFRAGGKQVAFCTNTVHGDSAPHCGCAMSTPPNFWRSLTEMPENAREHGWTV
jgi:hypothetical protein